MMRLTYTPRSLDDFEHILKRIAEDNREAAVRLGEDILKTCELLKSHPKMGERKDEIATGLRRFSCRGYGIYYRIDQQQKVVRVARFIHPALDVKRQSFD